MIYLLTYDNHTTAYLTLESLQAAVSGILKDNLLNPGAGVKLIVQTFQAS